jgi:voltage-gated potassium channel
MAERRHWGLFAAPIIAGAATAILIVMWGTGTRLPWLQGVMFLATLGLLAFTLADMLARDIRRSHLHPIGIRTIVLAILVVESVLLFAVNYLSISEYPGEIAGLTTPLDAVYFTMTTLMTIGFGDIAASGQIARGAVLLQMLFSLLLLTASARLLTSLIKSVTRDVGHDPDKPA